MPSKVPYSHFRTGVVTVQSLHGQVRVAEIQTVWIIPPWERWLLARIFRVDSVNNTVKVVVETQHSINVMSFEKSDAGRISEA